jgi:hypothetical protein
MVGAQYFNVLTFAGDVGRAFRLCLVLLYGYHQYFLVSFKNRLGIPSLSCSQLP